MPYKPIKVVNHECPRVSGCRIPTMEQLKLKFKNIFKKKEERWISRLHNCCVQKKGFVVVIQG